jgi:hypothetical protein
MNLVQGKLRRSIMVTLFSISFACFVYAAGKGPPLTPTDYQRCTDTYNSCVANCKKNYPSNGFFNPTQPLCLGQCKRTYDGCLEALGRPGAQISPLPKKSNPPTPNPRKGIKKVSGLPGKSIPTPSPSGPVLLEKRGKPSPTPTPSKKGR